MNRNSDLSAITVSSSPNSTTFFETIGFKDQGNEIDDIRRFGKFGITSHDIMPEIYKWLEMLSREDQIYFSQLYKDYYQLAKFLGQKDVPTATEFVHELYTKRNQILRETGGKAVLYNLPTETVGGKRARIKTHLVR